MAVQRLLLVRQTETLMMLLDGLQTVRSLSDEHEEISLHPGRVHHQGFSSLNLGERCCCNLECDLVSYMYVHVHHHPHHPQHVCL